MALAKSLPFGWLCSGNSGVRNWGGGTAFPGGAVNTEDGPGSYHPPVDRAHEQSGPRRKHPHPGVPGALESSLRLLGPWAVPSLTSDSDARRLPSPSAQALAEAGVGGREGW